LDKHIGRVIVKRYPSSSCTATDIGTYLKRVENAKGFKADALIVDYADIMRSSAKYNDRRFELDTIYQELRNIGIEFDIPVITATQLNREGLKELSNGGILTEEYIAESYGIARHVDCAVTINATPQDNANNQSVIYVCKNRDGEAGFSWRMFVDFKKALISEWTAPSIVDITNKTKKKRK
jgi:replicative DNA helicase